eukprot:547218-Amphidinium_carterae.1
MLPCHFVTAAGEWGHAMALAAGTWPGQRAEKDFANGYAGMVAALTADLEVLASGYNLQSIHSGVGLDNCTGRESTPKSNVVLALGRPYTFETNTNQPRKEGEEDT